MEELTPGGGAGSILNLSQLQSLHPAHILNQRQESLKSLDSHYMNNQNNQSQKSYSQKQMTAQLGANEGNSRFAKVIEVGVGRRSLHSSQQNRSNHAASVSGFSFQNIGQSIGGNLQGQDNGGAGHAARVKAAAGGHQTKQVRDFTQLLRRTASSNASTLINANQTPQQQQVTPAGFHGGSLQPAMRGGAANLSVAHNHAHNGKQSTVASYMDPRAASNTLLGHSQKVQLQPYHQSSALGDQREFGSPARKEEMQSVMGKHILRKQSGEDESLVQQPSLPNQKSWLNHYLGERHNSNFFNSIGMSQAHSMYRPAAANQGTLAVGGSLMQADFLQASQAQNSIMPGGPGFGFEAQNYGAGAESVQQPLLMSALRSGQNSQQQGFVQYQKRSPSDKSRASPPKHHLQSSQQSQGQQQVTPRTAKQTGEQVAQKRRRQTSAATVKNKANAAGQAGTPERTKQ